MLIIFDWDGTLSDSAALIISTMHQAAANLGLPILTDDAVRNIIGLGLPEAIQQLYPTATDKDVTALRREYSSVFLSAAQQPPDFFAGAQEAVEGLLQQNHTLAVATGKSRKGLDRVLRESDWSRYFQTTRCADETASKPHPLMLHEILQETGFGVADAAMVGDTEYDLDMARQAAMARVAVSYGAHSLERLQAYDPVHSTADLRSLLQWVRVCHTPT